jgi:hypothetical protein
MLHRHPAAACTCLRCAVWCHVLVYICSCYVHMRPAMHASAAHHLRILILRVVPVVPTAVPPNILYYASVNVICQQLPKRRLAAVVVQVDRVGTWGARNTRSCWQGERLVSQQTAGSSQKPSFGSARRLTDCMVVPNPLAHVLVLVLHATCIGCLSQISLGEVQDRTQSSQCSGDNGMLHSRSLPSQAGCGGLTAMIRHMASMSWPCLSHDRCVTRRCCVCAVREPVYRLDCTGTISAGSSRSGPGKHAL